MNDDNITTDDRDDMPNDDPAQNDDSNLNDVKNTTNVAVKGEVVNIDVDHSRLVELRTVEDVMENNFLRYSMSVIIDRALPDVRDGLKPVHRRIL